GERRLAMSASMLQGPAPAKISNRKMKHNKIAGSPMLLIGKNDRGKCALKYAAAISPQAMKAAGRVSKPMINRIPSTVSMTPATRSNEASTIGIGPRGDGGKLKSFCSPCCQYNNAATMRSKLRACGEPHGAAAGATLVARCSGGSMTGGTRYGYARDAML